MRKNITLYIYLDLYWVGVLGGIVLVIGELTKNFTHKITM